MGCWGPLDVLTLVAQPQTPSVPHESSRATLVSLTHGARHFTVDYSLYDTIMTSEQSGRSGDDSQKERCLPACIVDNGSLIGSR